MPQLGSSQNRILMPVAEMKWTTYQIMEIWYFHFVYRTNLFKLTPCFPAAFIFFYVDKCWRHRSILKHNYTSVIPVTHLWVSKLTIIGSDNGLSPGRRQLLSEPMLEYCSFKLRNKLRWNRKQISYMFIREKWISNYRLRNGELFVAASVC